MVSSIACIGGRSEARSTADYAADGGCATSRVEILSERIGSHEKDRELERSKCCGCRGESGGTRVFTDDFDGLEMRSTLAHALL